MRLKNELIALLTLLLSGCTVYTFTGSTLTPEMKTISIQQFYNNALLGPSNMSQVFSEKMRDYFQQNTNLRMVPSNGDLQFEGYIVGFTVTPVAPSASGGGGGGRGTLGDVAALTRVTITVHATYTNIKDGTFDFDKNFSFFVDFDAETTDLQANEDRFVDEIFNQIILDIFQASVANW
jgi:hypothetical protein